jgi:transcriptional regulator with XRE-family HTH domain
LLVKAHIVKNTQQIDGSQVRMARAGLRLSLKELASISGVSANTIARIEDGKPAIISTLEALRRCFEDHGVSFPGDGSVTISAEAAAHRKAPE